jgi:Cys-Gly metallodipeptidase DUG1
MTDLIKLMSKLVESDGTILIPGVQEMIPEPTPEEMCVLICSSEYNHQINRFRNSAIYNQLDYSISDIEEGAGASIALSSDKAKVLMGRMREPSLSLHGIEGAFWDVGAKTVIPAKVIGKFSLRYVFLPLLVRSFAYDFCLLVLFLRRHPRTSTHWSRNTSRKNLQSLTRRTS